MTERRSFKLLVRTRMAKTGESYTTARAALLDGTTKPATDDGKAPLAVSDEAIRERTGRGWEEWFDALDEWGAQDRPRRDIARWVAEQLTIEPLGWNAQAITMSYERARRGRAVGEHPDGFRAGVSKTVAVPVDRLFDAFVDSSLRSRWLPDGQLRDRTATKPKAAHFDWGDGPSRVHVTFVAKEADKSTATVSHERLADAAERDRMKAYWKHAMDALELELEG